jgi:hypothetical protein
MDMKQKIKSIICAVDFSEESMKAVEFAASLVGQNSEATLSQCTLQLVILLEQRKY